MHFPVIWELRACGKSMKNRILSILNKMENIFHGQNLKLVYLTVYMMRMLARLLKNLNNVALCIPLNAQTLNPDHEIDTLFSVQSMKRLTKWHGRITNLF
jgi:hypothetical protein